jgi:hypothetical protein
MVCWYLCLATSVRSHVLDPPGRRRPRTFREKSRRQPPLGPLEDTPTRALILLRRNGHWSGDELVLSRPESG